MKLAVVLKQNNGATIRKTHASLFLAPEMPCAMYDSIVDPVEMACHISTYRLKRIAAYHYNRQYVDMLSYEIEL